MKISVVIPCHNDVEWLPQSVESCLNQTYKDFEIVIVDDGSTDMTPQYLDWLMRQNNKNIVILRLPKNVGRGAARNLGNVKALGDIICVLDADDYNAPDRLKKTVEKFKQGADYVYGTAQAMGIFGERAKLWPADVYNFEQMLKSPLMENRIVHSSVAYTKKLALAVPYSEDRAVSDVGVDDWLHQVQVYKSGAKMDFISTSIVAYRVRDNAITKTWSRNRNIPLKLKLLKELELVPA